jgi:hypothetical protein
MVFGVDCGARRNYRTPVTGRGRSCVMMARRQWRALWRGVALAALVAGALLAALPRIAAPDPADARHAGPAAPAGDAPGGIALMGSF